MSSNELLNQASLRPEDFRTYARSLFESYYNAVYDQKYGPYMGFREPNRVTPEDLFPAETQSTDNLSLHKYKITEKN